MQRADAWRGRRPARALPRALRAEDSRGCSPPPASWARCRRRPVRARRSALRAAIGLAFQLLDDVLDVTGPEERTGKRRGTDLLDGTVTLPLILARERSPELSIASTCESIDGPGRRSGCAG